MYCKFYGLKEKPFNVTSDPAFFFFSSKHKEALSHLLYGVNERKGIIVLTGEIGTGKTTLTRFFINQLEKNVKTAFILNPYLSDTELLDAILNDFGLVPKEKTRLGFIWELNRFLLNESEAGNNVVLIIDEAQNLPVGMLEQVRLLSNLETEKSKLLQIVLVGQPELNDKLNLHELRQIRQRIMVKYHINPLGDNEIKDYIYHRLSAAGAGKEIEFCDDAIKEIMDFSVGTPRLINMLCDRALLAGFTNDVKKINAGIMKKCIEEFGYHFAGGRQ
ncbi:MAG: AAA family ATPase [Candidatus Omnitrophica bacterium]|nr:AAA family ATPase [Candidatus Omnitrophota bacterium]